MAENTTSPSGDEWSGPPATGDDESSIPEPLRAAAGLAALTIDEARRLPTQLIGLPVMAVSSAFQATMKLRQTYAGLVARGDELMIGLRPPPSGTAAWATFDDEEVPDDDIAPPMHQTPHVTPTPPARAGDPEPLPGYDTMTMPQLRGRLRWLTQLQLEKLVSYERSRFARPAYLTMLTNRLDTVRSESR